jgi:DNA-binding CsgD family transcriptional regulator/tetratricopeptide (TPR) repeat protein
VSAGAERERGRAAYERRAWSSAYESLSIADEGGALAAEDLELLAVAAYMLGRVDEFLAALERAHHAHLGAGEPLRAARAAVYLGINLAILGDAAQAGGWLGRAERLVEREGKECAERGYLLVPLAVKHEAAGDYAVAAEAAAEAAALGERFGDRDLFALGVHAQGHALIKLGHLEEGFRLLDEAMLAAIAGELSPIITGVVYCGAIAGCEEAYELRRAREWTGALGRWWEAQPEMVAFTGRCLAHRAEILQLRGEWGEALEEARRARERCERAMNRLAAGQASYQQAEVLRRQGDFAAAEAAYREASACGREPQPGLALLRLAQGDADAAAATIGRALAETEQPLKRSRLLPAYAEILVARGELDEALRACRELSAIADAFPSAMLGAIAAQVQGAVELASGDARAALVTVRRAWQVWQELAAPYEAARARVLVASACRALGDEDGASLELEAARGVFEQLGARPELARIDALQGGGGTDTSGLTGRELEVLRLVAAGRTNREIAATLVLSEHTVARHVQNIFAKLRVSSRTAATAFAFEHGLV